MPRYKQKMLKNWDIDFKQCQRLSSLNGNCYKKKVKRVPCSDSNHPRAVGW